jgi:hypothetical protein
MVRGGILGRAGAVGLVGPVVVCCARVVAQEPLVEPAVGVEPTAVDLAPAAYAEPCPTAAPAAEPSVSLLRPGSRFKVFGSVDTLAVFSTSRPFPSGIPLFLLPESPTGLDTNTFDLHARQTSLGAAVAGPKLGEFQSAATILTFLQNDNLTADDYGLLVYYAYGELKNESWRFAAGLQQDIFNPVSPSVVYLTKMYASGNSGSYRGQLRAERFFQQGDLVGTTVQVGLSEPLSSLVTDSAGRIEEDNGWPNVEGRVEFGLGERSGETRPLEVGFSGVVGQFRTTRTVLADPATLPPRAVIDTWGVGADVEWRLSNIWGTRAEFFHGQGLGEYNAGVGQSFNSNTFREITTTGGYGEVYCYLTETLHTHVGYGVDDPRDGDLAATQIRRNETLFVNTIWDISRSMQVSFEVDYRQTAFTEFQPGAFRDADGVIFATRFLMQF